MEKRQIKRLPVVRGESRRVVSRAISCARWRKARIGGRGRRPGRSPPVGEITKPWRRLRSSTSREGRCCRVRARSPTHQAMIVAAENVPA